LKKYHQPKEELGKKRMTFHHVTMRYLVEVIGITSGVVYKIMRDITSQLKNYIDVSF
jgi:hypothetical protein